MIKNLIYLDEPKMYSLSSQIFEGITDYILNKNEKEEEKSESQKGEIGSGRIVADVINSSNSKTEKRYLHDYSYSLFEEKLIGQEKVLVVNSKTNISEKDFEEKKSFIKVSAKATFNDIDKMDHLIKNFNSFGKAITCIQNPQLCEKIIIDTKQKGFQGKTNKANGKNDPLIIKAKKNGLHYNETILESLSSLIQYGYQNQLEIRQDVDKVSFSSLLKRDYLRENEDILIRKYSRKTEKELVIFGIITQSSEKTINTSNFTVDQEFEAETPKQAIINMIEILANIEESFSGKMPNEIVIDPIAIYTEL